MISRIILLAGVFSVLLFGNDVSVAGASMFTVNAITDGPDWDAGDGFCDDGDGLCTLRAAIEEANALAGADTIYFGIGSGPHRIQPSTALPLITETVTIDGYSEPGAEEATTLTPATLMIELDGLNTAGSFESGLALVFGSDGSVIKGLVINRFDSIGIHVSNSSHNRICGNYVGTDVTGTLDFGNTEFGIRVDDGASENVIGGTTPAERNLISGNDIEGLNITDSSDNLVRGNYVGTDATGSAALANTWGAIALMDGASYNIIGGTTPAERNIIAGGYTVVDPGSTGNVLRGNYVGTDVTGTLALGIIANGVCIQSNAFGNIIGGTSGTTPGGPCTGACNVISGNGGDGVHMQFDVSDNIVQGNYIGTDVTGINVLGNDLHGITLFSNAFNNVIGGTGPGEGNIISGSGMVGINLGGPDATGNLVQGNFIGTDVTGTLDLGNEDHGMFVYSSGNRIGGTKAGAGNLISGNGSAGINIGGIEAAGNLVQGNFIGTDITGTIAVPNDESGIVLAECSDNTIGGSASAQNHIFHNGSSGINLYSADDNTISYNRIQHNTQNGLSLLNSSKSVLTHNVIASNGSHGISGDDRSELTIIHNTIADNLAGGIILNRHASITILNSILWNNEAPYEIELFGESLSDIGYSNLRGGLASAFHPESPPPLWGMGMIDTNPLFSSSADGDYHLRGNSPCIDAGTDAGVYTDLDGDLIPFGGGFDMGADECVDSCFIGMLL